MLIIEVILDKLWRAVQTRETEKFLEHSIGEFGENFKMLEKMELGSANFLTRFFFFRLSCPVLPEIGIISSSQIEKLTKPAQILSTAKTELKIVQPATSIERSPCFSHSSLSSDDEMKKRKSVSILLPPEEYHTRIVH